MTEQTDADRLTLALGQAILGDPNYAGEWQAAAVVFQLDGRRRMFGYVWDDAGEWRAEIPDDFDVVDHADALRKAMADGATGAWKTCLVQLRRPGPKLTIDFDYDDVNRWSINPANLETRVDELRPR